MADELNIPTHRWYEPRNHIALAKEDVSRQYIYDSGIQKIDAWIISQPWGSPSSLFTGGEDGAWYDPSNLTTMFTDTAGTTAATVGDAVARIDDQSGNTANATQATTSARPILQQDADGQYYLQNDEIDDALTVTFPDMGTACTVAYVTASEVRLLEDQTISGAYTLPATDLYNIVIIDRALTFGEKVGVIRFLASKVDGVNYGAEIDRLTLIAINAVDVFVYDTSKDSDGGTWRTGALAQASSWYNEPLNTATRGSRREFPAVAVIVAESNKVTIYDGDDPTLPMWMVFNTANNLLVRATTVSSVTMQNGVLAVGSSDSGFSRLNFVSEQCLVKTTAGYAFPVQSISFRNTGQSIALDGSAGLVNAFVNDVAMTVLPDAPIDPATGLPVPTIAVATDGGVSVIKDDGTVYDSAASVAVSNLKFLDTGLFYQKDGGTALGYFATFADIASGDGFGDALFGQSVGTQDIDVLTRPTESAASGNTVIFGGRVGGTGIKNGVALHNLNSTDFTKGMSALLTSTYNTGWMNGDIKGAFLADTDDTDLVGSGELVTNGTFDVDISGWSAFSDATLALNANRLEVTSDAGFTLGVASTPITTMVGQSYVVSVDTILGTSAAHQVWVGTSASSAVNYNSGSITSTVTIVATFVATATTSYINLVSNDNGGTSLFDNVSVKLADADRSVNNNGLIVNGTITRTFVDEV